MNSVERLTQTQVKNEGDLETRYGPQALKVTKMSRSDALYVKTDASLPRLYQKIYRSRNIITHEYHPAS